MQFPEDCSFILCSFTDEEIRTLWSILPKTLQFGISKGFGEKYKEYLRVFHERAVAMTNDSSSYLKNNVFTSTIYIDDIISITAATMDQVLVKKGAELSLPLANVTLGTGDRQKVAHELLLVDLQGITGPVSFDKRGHRKLRAFDIRNFAPRQSSNMTGYSWEFVVSAAVISSSNNAMFIFYDRNGAISKESTVVFSDNSTASPFDKPKKWRRRGECNKSLKLNHSSYIVGLLIRKVIT